MTRPCLAVDTRDHAHLAALFERWIGVCLRAGLPEQAENCRADAAMHARLAERRKEVA